MADVILKNNAGKIWVNGAGKVLKAKQFSEIPIQDGLAFWGQADPALLTIVDGLVSEAYDVRDGYGGARKMDQTNVSDRPILNSDHLFFTGQNKTLLGTSQLMVDRFIIFKSNTNTNYSADGLSSGLNKTIRYNVLGAIGSLVSGVGGIAWLGNNVRHSSGLSPFFHNNIKYTLGKSYSTDKCIMISLGNPYVTDYPCIGHGRGDSFSGEFQLYEWGWYNRVLSETEVIYNINCLNQKYSLF